VRIHYHRTDRGTTLYHERLVVDRADVKVTVLDDYQGRDAFAGDTLILAAGAPVVWFVFPGLCRDVGRFHLADGTFTGWYTNLRAPIVMRGSDWFCTDLFLDHWLPADGGAGIWLDEDEFDHGIDAGLLSADDAAIARAERAAVDEALATGQWPPALARDLDLASALARLDRRFAPGGATRPSEESR